MFSLGLLQMIPATPQEITLFSFLYLYSFQLPKFILNFATEFLMRFLLLFPS